MKEQTAVATRFGLTPPLVVLLAAALVVRVVWVSAWHVTPVSDYHGYDTVAANLATHGSLAYTLGTPWVYKAPGWPILLAAIYRAFGHSVQAGTYGAALLSWGTCVAGAVVATRLLKPPYAIFSVAVMSFYPAAIVYTAVLGTEHLAGFLAAVIMAILVRGELTGRGTMLAIGLLDGALILTRPDIGGPMSLVIVGLLVARRADLRPVLARAGIVALGVLAVMVPWTVRNAIKFDSFIPVSTEGGVTFYLGTRHVGFSYPPKRGPWAKTDSPTAQQSAFWRAGLRRVKDDPLRWISLDLRRIVSSASDRLTYGWAHARPRGGWWPVLEIMLLAWIVLAVIGLVALLAAPREYDWRWFLVAGFVVSCVVLKSAFIENGGRHRLPYMTMILLLSGLGAQVIGSRLSARHSDVHAYRG